jgi:hypothetical protein
LGIQCLEFSCFFLCDLGNFFPLLLF